MMQISYQTPDVPRDFPNRKSGLLTFGIIMILMGSLAGCVTMFMPLMLVIQRNAMAGMQPQQAIQPGAVVMVVAIYAAIATGLIWTGIGSIRAQRWVRSIVLIFGTLWLAVGIMAIIGMALSLPIMKATMQAASPRGSPPVPATFQAVYIAAGLGFAAMIYLVIPGVFVLFYRSDSVRRTLEFYDPMPRWTDRCPLPVLGMSIACGLFALGSLVAIAYGVAPVFGVLLTGPAAAGQMLFQSILFAIASVWLFRRRIAGWILAVGMLVVFQVSMLVTLYRVDMPTIAAAMKMPPEQIAVMRANPMWGMTMMGWTGAIVLVPCLIYAIRIRHYFSGSDAETGIGR